MSAPVLYTAAACNFCHRNRITAAIKGVALELVEIDLVRRPPWYREKASGGSVPLLECDEGAFHGSSVINEYLEERWPEPSMLPGDAAERAAARMWIEWWNRGPTPAYEELLMNVRPEREERLRSRFDTELESCERRLEARGYTGGFWHGEEPGLVDASAAPVFDRFVGLRAFHDVDVPEALGRVRAWRDALLDHPAVQQSSPGEEELLAVFRDYRAVLTKAAEAGIEVPVSGGD